MKNIRLFLLAGLLLSAYACNKDFLDRKPLVGATEENFYRNEQDTIAAVNAAYAPLQFEMSPAGHFRWFWGDVMSDDAVKGGSGDNDAIELAQLETFKAQANNELVESEWSANYEGIYRANVVLEKVPPITMNEELKGRLLGEARFIRAWFFYNLVTMFGGVPLVVSFTVDDFFAISKPELYNKTDVRRQMADGRFQLPDGRRQISDSRIQLPDVRRPDVRFQNSRTPEFQKFHTSGFRVHWFRSKIQDPRSKIQDPKSKIQDQSPKTKDQRSKIALSVNKLAEPKF